MDEIIHDGNIYYIVPCKANCGTEWLTEDELYVNDGYCEINNCYPKMEEK